MRGGLCMLKLLEKLVNKFNEIMFGDGNVEESKACHKKEASVLSSVFPSTAIMNEAYKHL